MRDSSDFYTVELSCRLTLEARPVGLGSREWATAEAERLVKKYLANARASSGARVVPGSVRVSAESVRGGTRQVGQTAWDVIGGYDRDDVLVTPGEPLAAPEAEVVMS